MGRGDPLTRLGASADATAMTLATAVASAQEAAVISPVEVVGTTPLPGIGTPLSQVPYNVQSFGARLLERERASGAFVQAQ